MAVHFLFCCAYNTGRRVLPTNLTLMNTPEDIFEYAYLYIVIIFLGIPFTFLYNILAALIRSLGDSRTPVVFLGVASLINIVLDIVFVIVLHMGVEGPGDRDGDLPGPFRGDLPLVHEAEI